MCTVPQTLLAVCAGPKSEEEPCCCVRRLALVVIPSLKIIKDNSSRGHSFPPGSEPCIYGVLCVFGYRFMLMLSE